MTVNLIGITQTELMSVCEAHDLVEAINALIAALDKRFLVAVGRELDNIAHLRPRLLDEREYLENFLYGEDRHERQ